MSRRFTLDDQRAFAALSGDWNPVHVDPLFARRTAAGGAVVHGVHLLLHALEQAVALGHADAVPTSLHAHFRQFVQVGEAADVAIDRDKNGRLRLRVTVAGSERASILCGYDAGRSGVEPLDSGVERFAPEREPLALAEADMAGLSGIVPFAAPPAAWSEAFPGTARWLGAAALAELGTATRLVGMICPGLHSVFLELRARLGIGGGAEDGLAFVMGAPRHRLLDGRIAGQAITGSVHCLVRSPPAVQPGAQELRALVADRPFAGHHALVVGGSRGLGEVAAKLLAGGGASVVLTYARGAAEAEAVAHDIGAQGGECAVLRYEVGADAAAQLAAVAQPISHAYYFATPAIGRPASRFYDADRFAEMAAFFVDGFWDLARALRARGAATRLFYPSTVYIAERPRGLAEYAMAKAAGEALCAEIDAVMAPLRVQVARLPQLATDQNITSAGVAGGAVADALLPHLRAMHA